MTTEVAILGCGCVTAHGEGPAALDGPLEGRCAAGRWPADPRYVDVWVPPGTRKTIPVEASRHAFAYVFDGAGDFRDASAPRAVLTERVGEQGSAATPSAVPDLAGNRSLVLFDSGDEVTVQAGDEGVRFLLVSGRPIEEPVAWYGPIVMNTPEELQLAYDELREGTFIKHA